MTKKRFIKLCMAAGVPRNSVEDSVKKALEVQRNRDCGSFSYAEAFKAMREDLRRLNAIVCIPYRAKHYAIHMPVCKEATR